jgi:hypothetical protein
MYDYLAKLHKVAKRTNAGTAMASFRNTKRFEGASIFVLVVEPGCELDAVQQLVNSLCDDEPRESI